MLDLHPFDGHVVTADRAHAVVTPPYDAIPSEVRAAIAASDPDSYLGALPPASVGAAELDVALERCRTHLATLLDSDRYRPLGGPVLAVLAIGSGRGRAVAIVGDVEVDAFTDGRVIPHEAVRDDRVGELERYLDVVGVASSPVALAQRPHAAVTAATTPVLARVPDLAFRGEDDVDLALWVVDDLSEQRSLRDAVGLAGTAFIADGHHRAAAAARYAARTGATGEATAGRVLAALLPTDHLSVAPFHRRADGALPDPVPDREVDTVLDRVRRAGVGVQPLGTPRPPSGPGRVTVVVGGRWWELDARVLAVDDDPIEALDVRLVERSLLPLLTAGRAPAAVVPVAAPLGLGALDRPGAIGVAVHPPSVDVVLDLALAGRTVPPKTTYVIPKLRSGLIVTSRRG